MEVSAFMTEQLKEQVQLQRDHDEKLRVEVEAKLAAQKLETNTEIAKLHSKLAEQKQDMERKNLALQATIEKLRLEQQLPALQARLEGLHGARLLTEDELFLIEDALMDSLEPDSDGSRVAQLIALSVRLTGDAAFARQLRRKVFD